MEASGQAKDERAKNFGQAGAFAAFDSEYCQSGMTLRQYYIGQAIAGLTANPSILELTNSRDADRRQAEERWVAARAIAIADATIQMLVDEVSQ